MVKLEGAGGREESDEWEEFGNRKVVRIHDPRQPSQQEKEEHEMTHLPFRSWCRHCIMGRGREEDCRKSMEEERQVPEVHLDYMFMGDERERKTLAFLVARERETRAVLSTVVPRKTTGEWICRRLMAWLREIGLESVDIIVKSDNEPALTSLITSWSTMRAMTSGSRMIVENSPVGSSKSNGIVERAIQSVQGMIRTIRSDIEGRWGVKIDATHSIWPWIAEHAGFLLTRFEVGRDGKTAYERLKGKSAKVQGIAFAEGILWKRKRAGGPLGKLTCRKTVRYLKELDKMENKKESGKTQEIVEVGEVEVNEEEEEWMTEEEPRQGDEGGDLDPEQVRQGREEEMNYMVKTLKMFEFGSWEDATSGTSKMPTTTKWVDRAKKDDTGKTFVRCRLVARDFKPKREGPRDDLFAAMPPLEAKKALFAFVAGVRENRRAQGHDEVKLMFVDVKKAHLNAKCDEEEWVELPNEFNKFGRYAKLKRWLYGMRKAASGWEDDYARRLVEDGFQRGRAASTIFYHPKTQVRVVVHGDDFTFAGTESELRKIEAKMHEWYDVKVRGILGSGKRDVHEIEILGRNLTWTEEGLEYEGSDKHRRALLEGLGLNEESKAVNSAAVKPEEIGQEEDTEMLDASEAKRFRSLAETWNYMSSDRSDVQYAAKEVCKMMAKPTQGSWKRLKKAGRYLTGVEKVTWVMRSWRHDDKVNVDVHVDSDWAKGPERKSTSGGMMMINGTVVKHWSRTQATRALSTAEAEYYAVVTGTAEGLGMQSMMADLGVTTHVRIWTDSNAAKAIASRRDLGKTRHVELRYLWLQDVTKSGRVKMRRIPGEQNLADHLTKGKAWHQIETLIRGVGGIMKMSGKGGDERKKWQGE